MPNKVTFPRYIYWLRLVNNQSLLLDVVNLLILKKINSKFQESKRRTTANAAAADLHSVASCSYDAFFLLQDLVVLAEGGQEDEGGDVLETVNPLPPLRFLTAHVHDPGRKEELEPVREQEEV